jgi:hypothetical protein
VHVQRRSYWEVLLAEDSPRNLRILPKQLQGRCWQQLDERHALWQLLALGELLQTSLKQFLFGVKHNGEARS